MTATQKFIRLDDQHFAYLVSDHMRPAKVQEFVQIFEDAWPGKRLLVIAADEFIDLTGRYEIVPIKVGS